MAVAKAKAAPARTAAREEPAARMPDRAPTPDREDNVLRNRLGEPIQLSRIINQNDDKFDLNRMGIKAPEGWTYEWRTKSIKGWEDTQRMVDDDQSGWTPVPAERHDGRCMPKGYKGGIERAGLRLMERPAAVTAIAHKVIKDAANLALRESRSMAGLMQRVAPNSAEMTDFANAEARGASFIRSERTPVQNTGKYQYSLDE